MTSQRSGEGSEMKPSVIAATQTIVSLSSASPACYEDSRSREHSVDAAIVVKIFDRKVKLASVTDPTSLYALCRRWVRNDMPRKDQPGYWDCMLHLPRPLSEAEAGKNAAELVDAVTHGESETLSGSPEACEDKFTNYDLLASHLKRFRILRKRARKNQVHRIARYRHRLAFLLPPNSEPPRQVDVTAQQQHP